MADDSNKLSIKDFIEDDGTLDGLIRQLGDIIELVGMLEKMLKKDDVTKWTNGLKQGSLDYKIALQAATSLAEKLVATSTKLTEVRLAETKELARLEQLIKDENRERQREAEINSKAAGSYARMKLELKQLIDQYKEAGTVEGKVKIAGEMSRLSSNIMLADRQLKLMLNDYSKLTGAQKRVLAETERQIAANNAATKAVRDRAAAEANLKTKASQSADPSVEERVNAVLQKRIAIETELNKLSDAEVNNSMSSADMIQKRIVLKQQLAAIDEGVKQLEAELTMEQKVVAAQEKLNNLRVAATTTTESGRSQLEEVKYEEQLASAIQKTAAARAEAAAMGTQEYQEMIQAQQELKRSQLEVEAGLKLEEITVKADGTYKQLEARYKLVEQAMQNLDTSTEEGKQAFNDYANVLDKIGDSLDGMERKMGVASNRMSSRQREWNGLTNSVYQVTRELPNLAVRADTFFLAISNNIPIFVDEFKRATKELGSFKKALTETGKAFAKSIPLALILYALANWSKLQRLADNWFNTLQDGSLKMSAAYRRIRGEVVKVNDDAGKHIATLAGLASQWKRLSTDNERLAFLEEYHDEILATGYAVNDLVDAERLFSNITGLVVDAYMARGKAAAAMRLATEQYNEAIQEQIKADEKASRIAGKRVTRSSLARGFFDYFGGEQAGIKMTQSGTVYVPREVYEQLAREFYYSATAQYPDAKFSNNLGFNAGEGGAALYAEMERNLRSDIQEFQVPDELLYAMALEIITNGEATFGYQTYTALYDKIGRHMKKANRYMTQGNQFATLGYESLAEAKEYDKAINVPTADAEKLTTRVLSIVGSVTKTMNDAILGGMQESFAKQRKQAEVSYEELLDTLVKKREEIERLLRNTNLSADDRERLEGALSNVLQTWNYAYDQYRHKMSDIAAEERIAVLNTAKANIDNRLAAVKEGDREELELRKKSIEKQMQIEIAENARLEAQLQKSVAAIRAKYRLEMERAEREYFIKLSNWRKQDLENEQAYVNQYSELYAHNQADLERIAMQIELAENAELIEQGLISREAIIEKHSKKIQKIYDDHRATILQSEKSFWGMMQEFVTDGSYEQLAAQLHEYDIQLEAEKLQYKELIEVMPEYGEMLDQLYAKRKRLLQGQFNLTQFEKQQDMQSLIFGMNPQIGEREQTKFDLQQEWARYNLQLELFDNGQLDLTNDELDEIYLNLTRIGKEMQRVSGVQGTISAIADHGLTGLIQLPKKNPLTGKTEKDKDGNTIFTDLSSDQYDALDTALDSIKSNLNEVMQAYVDVAQAAYDAAQAQVDAARTVYEAELEARANGYANDVEGAKRELALEKQKAKQKEAILKQAQKAQERINTLQQISSLITGSAQILETFGAYPVVAGVLLAAMWGMFAMAKIKAAQVANQSSTYGEGGFELAVGGSHASGHDIKTGIQTQSGRNMVIEGGEGVGVFSRKAVSKYGNAIPQLVDAINDGSLSDLGYSPSDVLNGMAYEDLGAVRGSQYAKEIISLQPLTNRVDLTTVEGLLSIIISKQVGQPVVLPDGSIFERKGNKTTITRRN